MSHRLRTLLALAVLALAANPAGACSIPVFRYALERWAPSPYEVIVYHRGELSPSQRQSVREIEKLAPGANIEFSKVDLGGQVGRSMQAVWDKFGKGLDLPAVVVRFPDPDPRMPPAWTGPLDPAKVRSLISSRLREQISHQLIHGKSAVFLVLESGDAAADAEAYALLDKQLPKLEKAIALPVLSAEGPQLRSELPLTVSLPVMKLSRDNPEEQAFISMLLQCEDGLDKAKGPIVFTIFGRGRLLTALHGKDLRASEVESVCRFLCGACSCQVKELNPGIDLLFRANWEAILEIETTPRPREVKK